VRKSCYNVAFRFTREAGGYHSVVIWTSFLSKDDFDKWYTPKMRLTQEVVAEGITQEEAIELTRTTPFACRVAASIEEATDREGNINPDIFRMDIANAVFAERNARKVS